MDPRNGYTGALQGWVVGDTVPPFSSLPFSLLSDSYVGFPEKIKDTQLNVNYG